MELVEKYRRMLALRRALPAHPARGGVATTLDAAARGGLRALARDFPGALRELDTLPTAELEARLAALAAGAPPPWAAPMRDYHVILRAAFKLRLAEALSDEERAACPPALAASLRRPPGGRMIPLVLAHLAAQHGIDVVRLRALLLPARAPSPLASLS